MLNMTDEERRVIVFVCIVSLTGAGANYIAKRHSRSSGLSLINQNICKINLNTAAVQDLMTVRGIGRKLAERIVCYRTDKGRFDNLEELMNVEGITRYRLGTIKEMIYIE